MTYNVFGGTLSLTQSINLSEHSVHRFGGASTFFTIKTDDLFSLVVVLTTSLYLNDSITNFWLMTVFTFAWWWGLQCGGALCARAHWIIRP